MSNHPINYKERRDALMARREKRNPGMHGVQRKKPVAKNWRNLIDDTTRTDVVKSFVRGLRGKRI